MVLLTFEISTELKYLKNEWIDEILMKNKKYKIVHVTVLSTLLLSTSMT